MDFLERYYKEEFFGNFNKLEEDLAKIPSESMREKIVRSIDENEFTSLINSIHPEVVRGLDMDKMRAFHPDDIKLNFQFIGLLLKTPVSIIKMGIGGQYLYADKIADTLDFLSEKTLESKRIKELYRRLEKTRIRCPGIFGEEHCHMNCYNCWGRIIDRRIAPYIQLEGEWGNLEIREPENKVPISYVRDYDGPVKMAFEGGRGGNNVAGHGGAGGGVVGGGHRYVPGGMNPASRAEFMAAMMPRELRRD